MEGGPPRFPPGSTCPVVLGNLPHSAHHGFHLQDCHLLWWAVPDPSAIRVLETSLQHEAPGRPHNLVAATRVGCHAATIWALARSLAATKAISFDFSCLRVLRCFTSPRIAPFPYGFREGSPAMMRGGLPHSEISGSTPVCGSPKLIAAYHVLRRLPKPRHPPTALRSLPTERTSRRDNVVVKERA